MADLLPTDTSRNRRYEIGCKRVLDFVLALVRHHATHITKPTQSICRCGNAEALPFLILSPSNTISRINEGF